MTNIKKDIRIRVRIIFVLLALFGVLLISRVAYIQIVRGKELRAKGKEINLVTSTLEAERGNIYSADGALLSVTLPVFDIYFDGLAVHPDTFKNKVHSLAQSLSNLFPDKSTREYENDLKLSVQKGNRYFPIRKKVDYEKYMKMREFPIFNMGEKRGGFRIEKHITRINPYGLLGNRTIGLYRKNAEAVGLERKYDDVLQGIDGQRVAQRIAGGGLVAIDGTEVEAKHGRDIITTLDVNIQGYAESALKSVLEREQAKYGTCIVMETSTGAIKALANLGRQENGEYWEDYNYALRLYEPGSTFKINALMAAIDDGLVTIDSKVSANGGTAYFNGQKMSDSHLGMGSLSVKDAFAHSSNVACARLVYNNYIDNPSGYIRHLKKMHIMDRTGLDITGEPKPSITTQALEFRNKASLAWLAIGYEVTITPMRTCMMYNAIANNGCMMKPYLVQEIREYGKPVKVFKPEVVEKSVCKPSTVQALKDAAFEVVQSGTGKALKNNHYTVCGKTGTAQVADKGITYRDRVYNGSFVGFFPKDNPMYTICVVIRTKKGANNYYGGQIALPVFKEVADRLYAASIKKQKHFLDGDTSKAELIAYNPGNIKTLNEIQSRLNCFTSLPNAKWVTQSIDSTGHKVMIANPSTDLMPSLISMGLRDAISYCEQLGLNVVVSGKGKVISQSIPPKSEYRKGQKIQLQLL